VGSKYAVVFSNGTAALHGAYYAAGLAPGDEFITSPLTFAATANAGLYLGARPVFVDILPNGNIDPKQIEGKITRKTKLICPIDYTGNPVDHAAIKKIAKKHKLLVVEDACHALGGSRGKQKIGSISDLTVFSFHPVKSITTGEGGAVTTNDPELYRRLCTFRTHGITKDAQLFENTSPGSWYHEMQDLGFNYRLTDIQAALGESQLKKIHTFLKKRQAVVGWYASEFKVVEKMLELPCEQKNAASGWHLYVIRLKNNLVSRRAEIFEALRDSGIGVQVHYIPVYWHPYYQKLGFKKGLCPKAEAFYEGAISLPLYPGLTRSEVRFVAATLKKIISQYV
jgi:UDP-4-amino-4,6-dideoxy-N-acetyl-beta-L-altrosamine transaminase